MSGNSDEWNNLVAQGENTKQAWAHSNVAYVITEDEHVIGYVRGLTDNNITLFICELLIAKNYRGQGLGTELIEYVHNLYPNTRMELLASSDSKSYYEQLRFRPFYGFRKTILE